MMQLAYKQLIAALPDANPVYIYTVTAVPLTVPNIMHIFRGRGSRYNFDWSMKKEKKRTLIGQNPIQTMYLLDQHISACGLCQTLVNKDNKKEWLHAATCAST